MLNISLTGMLWTVVNLLVLYVLLRKFLFQPVTALIEARQKEIADNMAAAEEERAQAERARAEYDEKLREAGREAETLVTQAKARGEREYQAILAAAQADAGKTAAQARAQMEADRAAMLSGARKELASLALLCAAKVVGREMDGEDEKALVDNFLTEAGEPT